MQAMPPIPPAAAAIDGLFDTLFNRFQPPDWVVSEAQNRIVLLLNHLIGQEEQAKARLLRQKGRVVSVKWRSIAINFVVTPAGLLDKLAHTAAPDLTLTVLETSPLALLGRAMASEKPGVRIEGDVQLAGEINWLVDHLRWDMEEDLSRLLGDAPAHTLANAARRAAEALRSFAPKRSAADASSVVPTTSTTKAPTP